MGKFRAIVAGRKKSILTGPALWCLAAVGATGLFARFSAWPSALVIRAVFAKGARATVQEMEQFAKSGDAVRHRALQKHGTQSCGMDIFQPATASAPPPTVVWIHGGAWISGTRRDIAPYLRMLAAQGFAVVGIDYPIAPGKRYPTAVSELSRALRYLTDNAAQLGIDAGQIVLAGDSAGAQLASQLAAMATSEDYASQVGIESGIKGEQVSGVVLCCGVYDLEALSRSTGVVGWGFKTALWAYAGERDWSGTPAARDMSTLRHVTGAFPPAFVTGGNGDGLTGAQSIALADRLAELGVPVTRIFWDDDHEPALPHEYQFHLRFPEAHHAFREIVSFLRARTGSIPNTDRGGSSA